MLKQNFVKVIIASLVVFLNMSMVYATPSCVFVKFSDTSSYSKLDTSNLLSDVLIEKIINDNVFSVKETKMLDSDVDKMYIDDYEEMESVKQGEISGDYSLMFNNASFGKKSKKIYESVKGDIVYPEVIKKISLSNDVSYIIHGTVKQAISYEESNTTFKTFLVDLIGGKENKVSVVSYVRIIDGNTGNVIWGNETKGVGDKLKINRKDFTFGGKRYDSAMYYNAVNNLAEKIVEKIKEDIAKGDLVLEDRGV